MLLDKYAKSVYVPSKDVYFVALYYHYGKFTEMTPFEKKKYAPYYFGEHCTKMYYYLSRSRHIAHYQMTNVS